MKRLLDYIRLVLSGADHKTRKHFMFGGTEADLMQSFDEIASNGRMFYQPLVDNSIESIRKSGKMSLRGFLGALQLADSAGQMTSDLSKSLMMTIGLADTTSKEWRSSARSYHIGESLYERWQRLVSVPSQRKTILTEDQFEQILQHLSSTQRVC